MVVLYGITTNGCVVFCSIIPYNTTIGRYIIQPLVVMPYNNTIKYNHWSLHNTIQYNTIQHDVYNAGDADREVPFDHGVQLNDLVPSRFRLE